MRTADFSDCTEMQGKFSESNSPGAAKKPFNLPKVGLTMKNQILPLLVLLIATPCLAGHIYWTDRFGSSTRTIRRMGLNGSAPTATTPLILVGTPDCRGIAVNVAANRLYYGVGTGIAEANLNGTGASTRLTGLTAVRDLKWDAAADRLYWCDQTASGGLIRRTAVVAPWVAETSSTLTAPDAYYMDIQQSAQPQPRFFWGTSGANIESTAFSGTGTASSSGSLLSSGSNVRGLAVDEAGNMLYWTERDAKAIFRAPIPPLGQALDLTKRETLYQGLDTPHGLEIDPLARKIYWVDSGTNAGTGQGDGGVSRGDMDSPRGPMEIFIGTTNAAAPPRTVLQGQPWDVDLDLRSANYAEWTARFFRADAAPAVTASQADADGDGLKNALEYALATNPLAFTPQPWQATRLPDGRWQIRFTQIGSNTDLRLSPQVSADLVTWHEDPATYFHPPQTSTLPGNDARLSIVIESKVPARFVRLSATLL